MLFPCAFHLFSQCFFIIRSVDLQETTCKTVLGAAGVIFTVHLCRLFLLKIVQHADSACVHQTFIVHDVHIISLFNSTLIFIVDIPSVSCCFPLKHQLDVLWSVAFAAAQQRPTITSRRLAVYQSQTSVRSAVMFSKV